MNFFKKMNLDGTWQLTWEKNKRVCTEEKSLVTIAQLHDSGYATVTATVPGNFELDLYHAGVIEDPFFGMNPLKVQELEDCHMWYSRTFQYEAPVDENTLLHFEGIDTLATIYVNGILCGSTDNMFIAHEMHCASLKQGENEIVVHIQPVVLEARNREIPAGSNAMRYNYDSLAIRKAPHMYGWDIMPRMISGGLWRSVWIEQKPVDRINDIFSYTLRVNPENKDAAVAFFYNVTVEEDLLKGYSLHVKGSCGDSTFSCSQNLWHTYGKLEAYVSNCHYWFPKNAGQPNLYDITVTLCKDGVVKDIHAFRMGIRTVELDRTSTTNKNGDGEFCIKINGKKIFVLGTNWVPVDAFHSNDINRLPKILELLDDIGCNAVRCWGGNVYEHDTFFDFCDEHGILIWQDFAMGCALYPQEQKFCDMLETELVSIIKRYRNHASLAIWAGDNECDYSYLWSGMKRDPNKNIITRKLIPAMLELHDFTRPYLPSSPYIDEKAFQSNFVTQSAQEDAISLSEEHLWGPRDYYKGDYYRTAPAHFASETGYHGCPSPKAMEKFLSKEKLWPYEKNEEWLVHAACMEIEGSPYAYRIPLMVSQVKTLFGEVPDNLPEFAKASQISQAEAFKYFIERFRATKWRRTGIIWWNLMDGWAQISDAVVDYSTIKKLAYFFIKRSQQPVCMMFKDQENWYLPLVAVNDTQEDVLMEYTVTDLTNGIELMHSTCKIAADSATEVWRKTVTEGEKNFYLMEWFYNGGAGKNHYLSGTPTIRLEDYLNALKQCGMDEWEGF